MPQQNMIRENKNGGNAAVPIPAGREYRTITLAEWRARHPVPKREKKDTMNGAGMPVITFTADTFRAYVDKQYGSPMTGDILTQVQHWLDRGDGAAAYENQELGHPGLGECRIVSYGSPAAQLETDTPPEQLPDMGGNVNWRYRLAGVYRPGPGSD
jgi:hypothetical protein